MSRRRILLMTRSLHLGGAERVVVHLARRLDPARFQVEVCCTHEAGVLAGELERAGLEVRMLGGNGRSRFAKPFELAKLIRGGRYDVAHSHGTSALMVLGPVAWTPGLPPLAHTFHFGNYPHIAKRYLAAERVFCKFYARLVAVGETQRQAILRYHRPDPARLRTIWNGVDPLEVPDPASLSRRRREVLGIEDGTFAVGTVAVLSRQKGVSDILRAAKAFEPARSPVRFFVVGGGPLLEDLRAEAKELGVTPQVTFTGWRSDALELLPLFDAFLLPSLWEGFSMVILEAMAAGLPVIASRVGDNAIAVENGSSGLLVPPGDSGAIESAVASLASDPSRARAMGQRGRERFLREFHADRMIAAHEALYEEMAP